MVTGTFLNINNFVNHYVSDLNKVAGKNLEEEVVVDLLLNLNCVLFLTCFIVFKCLFKCNIFFNDMDSNFCGKAFS